MPTEATQDRFLARVRPCLMLGMVATFAGWACSSGGLRKSNLDASGSGGLAPGTGGIVGAGGTTATGGHSVMASAAGGAAGTGGATVLTSPGGAGGSGGQGGRDAAATGPQQDAAAKEVARDQGDRRDSEPALVDVPLVGAGGASALDAGAGGTGGNLALDAGPGAVDGALATFCVGGESRVEYKGQTFAVPATSKVTYPMMDCCLAVAATLHTYDALGADIDGVVRIPLVPQSVGTLAIPDYTTAFLRTMLYSSTSGSETEAATTGAARVGESFNRAEPWTLGLCLAVEDPASPLRDTKVYVPSVTVAPSAWASRFRLWLLKDTSLTAVDAEKADLDTLELASEPLVDLWDLAFVEIESTSRSYFKDEPCMWMGLNTAFTDGATMTSKILKPGASRVDMSGVPFVVEADGQRIYLGAFATIISSVGSRGPQVYVETIADDGFPIYPPSNSNPKPPDPRNDPRILKVLSETGKSVP
jgi:hypothetical protein